MLAEPYLSADGFRTRSPGLYSLPVAGLDLIQDDTNKLVLSPLYSDKMEAIATYWNGMKATMNKELPRPLCSGSLSSNTGIFRHSFSLFFPLSFHHSQR